MTIKAYPHSGRRCHYRKLRGEGFRDRCLANRWALKGGYAEKTIRGAVIMQTIAKRFDDGHILVRFQRKNDFWSVVTSRYLENDA